MATKKKRGRPRKFFYTTDKGVQNDIVEAELADLGCILDTYVEGYSYLSDLESSNVDVDYILDGVFDDVSIGVPNDIVDGVLAVHPPDPGDCIQAVVSDDEPQIVSAISEAYEGDVEVIEQELSSGDLNSKNSYAVIRRRTGVRLLTPEHVDGMKIKTHAVKCKPMTDEAAMSIRVEEFAEFMCKFTARCIHEAASSPHLLLDDYFRLFKQCDVVNGCVKNLKDCFFVLQEEMRKTGFSFPLDFVSFETSPQVTPKAMKSYVVEKNRHELKQVRKRYCGAIEGLVPKKVPKNGTSNTAVSSNQMPITNFIGD